MPSSADYRHLPLTACVTAPCALQPRDVALWRKLLFNEPGLCTPFLSYAFAATAAEVFYAVRVCQIRRGEITVGFFSFQFRSIAHRLFGIGQRIGGELSDYFGIVAESGLSITPRELLRLAKLSTMIFTHLDESQTRFGLDGESPKPGLRIELPQGGRVYWDGLLRENKNLVKDTERRERKLINQYGRLNFIFRQAQPRPYLEHLIAAKRAQYRRTNAGDSLQSARVRRFLLKLAGCEDPECKASMSTLHAGDTWVASHFGLMCGGTLHYWFPVYNPELHEFAPGRLLLKAIIDSSETHRVTAIDRGLGDAPAKQDFATAEHTFLNGLWSRPGLKTFLYRAGLSLQWRVGARFTGNSKSGGHAD